MIGATPIAANSARFSLGEVARIAGGVLERGDGLDVCGVTTDSRAAQAGCLFVALRGDRFDGHRFVESAMEAGATAALVDREAVVDGLPGLGIVRVADTCRALGDLAHAHRSAFSCRVVAVTGSAGKTTTKELAAAALRSSGASVLASDGNLNNLIGLPMSLLQLSASVDVAVMELGTSAPGEIGRLAEIAAPDVGIVTLIAPAHTEGLGSIEDVAREKCALLDALSADAVAVLNADDPALGSWSGAAQRVIKFGSGQGVDVHLVSSRVTRERGTECVYAIAGVGEVPATLALMGTTAGHNGAAALAIAIACGRDPKRAAEGLEGVLPKAGRMQPREGRRGLCLIDDSYNANPASVVAALDTAMELARLEGGRLVAVLGDMKELGPEAPRHHAAVTEYACTLGAAALILCGPDMATVVDQIRESGTATHVQHVSDVRSATAAVVEVARPGDVVLVKGSRSMGMEAVVGALAAGGGA